MGNEWVSSLWKNIDKFDVMSICENSLIGYFLEIDVEYSDKLHELHNDYPLAPEKTCCFKWYVVKIL